MSKKVNGIDLGALKNIIIEKLYQVQSESKLKRIKDQLEILDGIMDKYDTRWENLMDDFSLFLHKGSKKYYTILINDIFDRIDEYTDSECETIATVLQDVVKIAEEEILEEIRKIFNIGK